MSEIYRDRSEGTAAKRQELLRRRRDELVTMPHAVRRVVVARSARIAASMVAALFGVGLIATSLSPSLAQHLANAMPGIQPAPLSTLLAGSWLVGLVAWAISRARVEHRFAVAMSQYVLPSNDLDLDVERLDHERPDDIARSMGHDLEVRSAAWPILAASVVIPATALWMARGARTHGWPVMSEYELSLALHAKTLALIGFAGAIGAIVMTRKAARLPVVATLAIPFGIAASASAMAGFVVMSSWAWLLCGMAVVVGSVGLIARALRKERALLEVEDPAAGSELFTIRGMLRELRAGMVSVQTTLRQHMTKRTWFAVGAVAFLGTIGVVRFRHHPMHVDYAQIAQPLANRLTLAAPVHTDDPIAQQYSVQRIGGRFVIEATLNDHGELDVPMTGFDTIPMNWRATLDVELASPGTIGIVKDTEHTTYLSSTSPRTSLTIEACTKSRSLSLHLQQEHAANAKVMLYVVPTLTVASCSTE